MLSKCKTAAIVVYIAGFLVAGLPLRSALADNPFPIPFIARPDWKGFAPSYPNGPRSVLLLTTGLKYKNVVSVYYSVDKVLTDEAAARSAYNTVFVRNAHGPWPAGGAYFIIDIYGPRNEHGQMPFSGYIFEMDSENRWINRTVGPTELSKLEYLLFHKAFT